MYSTCKDTCPLTAQQIKGALDQVGKAVPTLAISVDPANDTQLNARRFVNQQGLTKRMRFLLGTRAQLQPIWKAYGIRPQGRGTGTEFDHSAYVVLVDKQRHAARRLAGRQADPGGARARPPAAARELASSRASGMPQASANASSAASARSAAAR